MQRRGLIRTCGSFALLPSALNDQRRHAWSPHLWYTRGTGQLRSPGRGAPIVTKEQLAAKIYHTKSRSQWDYNRIDERLTAASEFTRMDNRPDFGGPREADAEEARAYPYVNSPKWKKLHEHFDEYIKPGTDPKVQACRAVKEHWDSEYFYYPGEAWQQNRPSFRSVPKELLNKQTFYHWSDWILRPEELQTTTRPRSFNPIWPPPGYKVPKMVCKKEFIFGVEEPGLVHEVERYYWHRMWFENNCRQGWIEVPLMLGLLGLFYYVARKNSFFWQMRVQTGNMWYPGRRMIRCFGEPRDPAKERWWWQEPLENTKSFPEEGMTWYLSEVRFGYARWVKEQEERKKLEAVVQ
jgi:hypothetical protein